MMSSECGHQRPSLSRAESLDKKTVVIMCFHSVCVSAVCFYSVCVCVSTVCFHSVCVCSVFSQCVCLFDSWLCGDADDQ